MSQGDIELSVISKNFFFSFFNYFIVFTALGSFAYFYEIIDRFRDSLRDTTWVASQLAQSLQRLSSFYTNLIILQGLGLFPLRLLEIGSVSLYPFYRMAAKTPRGTLTTIFHPYIADAPFQILQSSTSQRASTTAFIFPRLCSSSSSALSTASYETHGRSCLRELSILL